jgi:hypothetical protein
MATSSKETNGEFSPQLRKGPETARRSDPVKKIRRSRENVRDAFENTAERLTGLESGLQKTGCRAFVSREFWSKCAGASAARNLNPAFIAMTEIQVKRLVNEAVLLHRDIAIRTDRLKTLKADLVREARRHEHEFTPTENGGSRWSVTGNNGCIARVNFPAPALVSNLSPR